MVDVIAELGDGDNEFYKKIVYSYLTEFVLNFELDFKYLKAGLFEVQLSNQGNSLKIKIPISHDIKEIYKENNYSEHCLKLFKPLLIELASLILNLNMYLMLNKSIPYGGIIEYKGYNYTFKSEIKDEVEEGQVPNEGVFIFEVRKTGLWKTQMYRIYKFPLLGDGSFVTDLNVVYNIFINIDRNHELLSHILNTLIIEPKIPSDEVFLEKSVYRQPFLFKRVTKTIEEDPLMGFPAESYTDQVDILNFGPDGLVKEMLVEILEMFKHLNIFVGLVLQNKVI